jgi:hypothetical protein
MNDSLFDEALSVSEKIKYRNPSGRVEELDIYQASYLTARLVNLAFKESVEGWEVEVKGVYVPILKGTSVNSGRWDKYMDELGNIIKARKKLINP